MDKARLEEITVAAITRHRQLFNSDQAVYEEWRQLSEDVTATAAQVKSLQTEYLARQKKTVEQQDDLADMLDILGFIPQVD